MRTVLLALLLAAPALAAGCVGPGADLDPEAVGDLPVDLPVNVTRLTQVDPGRWSGEPSILALTDGTLLITGAGGLTRYVEDPTDAPGNAGQSYLWRSTDQGATWEFIDLGLPSAAGDLAPYRNAILGVEGDLAEDEAGTAYFIDLAALAANGLSTSTDSGETWTDTQNPLVGLPGTDRPWVAALGDGEVFVKYLQIPTGHRVARSTDGGLTFPEDVVIPSCGQADMTVDLALQEVLVPCLGNGEVGFVRTAAGQAMEWEKVTVRELDGEPGNIFPSMAVADAGEYVLTWAEVVDGEHVIRVVASLDHGETWTEPLQVSTPNSTAVFPWIDANPDGVAGVVWYENLDGAAPSEVKGDWHVMHASFRIDPEHGLTAPVITRVTDEPNHQGAICGSGLGCVLDGRSHERRLLDFFEVDVDGNGVSHIAYTSTLTDVPTIWYAQVAAVEG